MLWIVEDSKAEQVYKSLRKLKMDYTTTKSQYTLPLQKERTTP